MAVIYQKGLSTHTRGWADLDLDFTKHPVTKDITRKLNVEAVKRSVRNLIQTNKYDKKFHPEVDGGVTRHLFGLATAATKHDISEAIAACLHSKPYSEYCTQEHPSRHPYYFHQNHNLEIVFVLLNVLLNLIL